MKIFFEKAFEGYQVPYKIKIAAENICTKFNIYGICDPMYISNVIAFESYSGDGNSHFTSDIITNETVIAKRLINAYGCNIKNPDMDEILNILKN